MVDGADDFALGAVPGERVHELFQQDFGGRLFAPVPTFQSAIECQSFQLARGHCLHQSDWRANAGRKRCVDCAVCSSALGKSSGLRRPMVQLNCNITGGTLLLIGNLVSARPVPSRWLNDASLNHALMKTM
jgi:hypothetical protein